MENAEDIQTLLANLYNYATPYIWPLLRYTSPGLSLTYNFLYTQVLPLIQPLLLRLFNLSSESPAVGVALFLAALYIGVKMLFVMQRMMGWVSRMVMTLGFYGVVAVAAAYVYQRGVERTASDVMNISQIASQKFSEEYTRYQDMQKNAGAQRGGGQQRQQQPVGKGWF